MDEKRKQQYQREYYLRNKESLSKGKRDTALRWYRDVVGNGGEPLSRLRKRTKEYNKSYYCKNREGLIRAAKKYYCKNREKLMRVARDNYTKRKKKDEKKVVK